MKKKLITILFGLGLSIVITGCEKEIASTTSNEETLYTYVAESSADAQFESSIGTVAEQPILDKDNKQIGKRLYVDSSRELITKESAEEFYNYVKSLEIDYEEIIISIGNNEAIDISLKNNEAWYCTINENMELTKIKKLYN